MALTPRIVTPPPGPNTRAQIAAGTFDMQSIYRSVIFDDQRSEGPYLVDVDDNVYLDLFSSFALGALGYNHPAVRAAVASPEHMAAAANASSTPFVTTPDWIRWVQALQNQYAPRGMSKVFCVDSGGEGVESALKIALIHHGMRRRVRQGKPENPLMLSAEEQRQILLENAGSDAVIVSFAGAFHGRGFGSLSATHSKLTHKADIPAFPWPCIPFPTNRWPLDRYAEENARAEAESLAALDRVIAEFGERIAGVLVEPIQSEGGDRHASPAFFRALQERTRALGCALILDEVQTGVAITGKLWCHEHFDLNVPPDLVAFGKKMNMGGCFMTSTYDVTQFGRMYQTRNGDRARAIVALATLDTIVAQDLVGNAARVGAEFLEGLSSLEARFPALVAQARGRGFLLAFDMPTVASRDDFLKRCLGRGVFASYTGVSSVRLRPHLITNSEQVRFALAVFGDVLMEMAGENPVRVG